MNSRPIESASLSDIREDTIMLTGSMSLVATALFGSSGRLMKFLQTNIPASAIPTDQRYRKWVFALSKAGPMRLAQQVAERCKEEDHTALSCVFPTRLPSWRAHWRGDRAYLVHLDLVPRMIDAMREPLTMRLVKDPSLRFDPAIPWELTLEDGDKLTAVWRDTNAQAVRKVRLIREGAGWSLTDREEFGREDCALADDGSGNWLKHFLQPSS